MDCDNVPYFNQITCPLGQFKCKNNRCISLMYRCDNQIDCIGEFLNNSLDFKTSIKFY